MGTVLFFHPISPITENIRRMKVGEIEKNNRVEKNRTVPIYLFKSLYLN